MKNIYRNRMNRYNIARFSKRHTRVLTAIIGLAFCCGWSISPKMADCSSQRDNVRSSCHQIAQDSSLTHPGIRFSLVSAAIKVRQAERLPHRALITYSLPQHHFHRPVKLEYRLDLNPAGVPTFVGLVKTGQVDPKFVQAVMLHLYRWRFSPVQSPEQVTVHLHLTPAETES